MLLPTCHTRQLPSTGGILENRARFPKESWTADCCSVNLIMKDFCSCEPAPSGQLDLLSRPAPHKYFITSPQKTESTHLPSVVRARGVGLVQPGGPIEVKSHDKSRDTKRSAAIALRVPLSREERDLFHLGESL